MSERMTRCWHVRAMAALSAARTIRARRGSVLVLVMAILGILFVTGVTLLTTMNFEARLIQFEREAGRDETSVELVGSMPQAAVMEGLILRPGVGGDGGTISERRTDEFNSLEVDSATPNNGPVFRVNRLTWAELPGVHGMFGPIEPSYVGGEYVFDTVTDFETMRSGKFQAATINRSIVDTYNDDKWAFEYLDSPERDDMPDADLDGLSVDADGDGIMDTRQFRLFPGDLPPEQLAILAAAVNAPTNPTGHVYLGLRMIPHGAMVNLNDSHPALIDAVLELGDDNWPPLLETNGSDRRRGPYSPALEEGSLRRRGGLLPPRVVPVSAIQGNAEDMRAQNPPGGGDFGQKMFAQRSAVFPSGESVRTGNHQYWAYSYESQGTNEYQEWQGRMVPGSQRYDRRHLVTTISHDDQLMRGATVALGDVANLRQVDVVEEMREAVRQDMSISSPPKSACEPARFEYVNYPHTIASGYEDVAGFPAYTWCECEVDPECTHDLRKGRLRLSLPWLDTATAGQDPTITIAQRNNLIQEAFMMLLLNARSQGDEWGWFENYDSNGDGTPDENDTPAWRPAYDKIAIAAASLTANMIDFMDNDPFEDPTSVAVRSFNFGTGANLGGPTGEVVYGLERQPFITEIAALVEDDGGGGIKSAESAFAVELFNPNDGDVPLPLDNFFIRVTKTGEDISFIANELPPRSFLVVYTDGLSQQGETLKLTGDGIEEEATDPALLFENGDTVYLLRANPDAPKDPLRRIVVDQFEVGGDTIADPANNSGVLWSLERRSVAIDPDFGEGPWYAPIPISDSPATAGEESLDGTLGKSTLFVAGNASYPVEVLFANTGSFSTAFPTTGMLLTLMRHANREINDPVANPDKLAFTTRLRGGNGTIEVSTQIDNGRMPIFDLGFLHHVDPAYNPIGPVWPVNRPGELMHLPWGQLVFDYFTALPLANDGPYRADQSANNDLVDWTSQPRVDQGGLRVHGRININAAPWTVLQGLPFVARSDIPQVFRDQAFDAAYDTFAQAPADSNTYILGEARARAIVAYRQAREDAELQGGTLTTGDYGSGDPNGRGWTAQAPVARRGTGFMALGELANVRHPDAGTVDMALTDDPLLQMDRGQVGTGDVGDRSYLKAVAVLACLGDWATVRSHVFTVYGTLRGGLPGDSMSDINDRALRFQETIDRLPVFMGAPEPVRIGERVIGKYRDVLTD